MRQPGGEPRTGYLPENVSVLLLVLNDVLPFVVRPLRLVGADTAILAG